MTTTYLTGTRYPGKALKAFLPDYLDSLAQRGYTVLTTNKPGVDRLILQHCDQHHMLLEVIEFTCDSGDNFRNRRVKAKSGTVQIHKVVSPSWQRSLAILIYRAIRDDRIAHFCGVSLVTHACYTTSNMAIC